MQNKALKYFLCGLVVVLIITCISLIIGKKDKTTTITTSEVNLSDYNTSILINRGGEYTLTGELNHSVIIDAEGEKVTLILNNVTIKASNTAGIIGKDLEVLTIYLKEGTTNLISDGGASKYDAAIFTTSKLVIDGPGTLNVYGNQNEGIATKSNNMTINNGIINITSKDNGLNAGGDGGLITINNGTLFINASGDGIDSNKNLIINGGNIFVMGSEFGGNASIDTKIGYKINGGTVVALGSDMLENPRASSKQNSILFNLDDFINANTLISLTTENDEEIISFISTKKFKTIVISTSDLIYGYYKLYMNGEHSGNLLTGIYVDGNYTPGTSISINGTSIFTVNSSVNVYGRNNMQQRR